MTSVRLRLLSLALSAPLALAAAAPAQAGFWEDLFGIPDKPAAPPPARAGAENGLVAKRAKQSRNAQSGKRGLDQVAANKALKASQAGKDPAMLALRDNTLRPGDVVSGPNGLMVYMGGDPENPASARFASANDPNLAKHLRETLKGLKRPAAAAAPDAKPQANDRVMQAVSIERDGRTIRVIGPYQGGAE